VLCSAADWTPPRYWLHCTIKIQDIQTFNIGFEEEHNEAHLAKMMAEKFNYGFKTMQLEDKNLYDQLINATYFQDEPVMHLSEPHLLALF
jgi:asparagine synthase (glutamine-hydrolysing)